jgi:hypothetical protein
VAAVATPVRVAAALAVRALLLSAAAAVLRLAPKAAEAAVAAVATVHERPTRA